VKHFPDEPGARPLTQPATGQLVALLMAGGQAQRVSHVTRMTQYRRSAYPAVIHFRAREKSVGKFHRGTPLSFAGAKMNLSQQSYFLHGIGVSGRSPD